MYKKVMVTLDGSDFAECGLQQLEGVVKGDSEVIIFRAVDPVSANESNALSIDKGRLPGQGDRDNDPADIHESDYNFADRVSAKMGEKRAQAESYISKIVTNLVKKGIKARGEIVVGKAAEEILDYSEKNNIDLIIITTHGRSGIARWAFGSVADRVARHSTVPVLLVTPPGCRLAEG